MANHLVSLAGFRQPMTAGKFMQEASYGERGSNHHHLSVLPKHPISQSHQVTENHKCFQLGGGSQEEISFGEGGDEKPMEGGKLRRQSRGEERRQALVLRRIGLWFLASSISYALKKAKLLYKYWFCVDDGDAFNSPRMGNIESSLVDAYFSLPVVSATTATAAAPYGYV